MRKIFLLSLLSFSLPLQADMKLNLRDVERLVLDYNFGQKAAGAGVKAAHEKVIQKYGDILPTIDFSSELIKDTYPQSFLVIRQPIPWVPQWSKEREVLKIAEDIAARNKTLDRQTLLNKVQKQYFRIQFLEQQKLSTLQNFKLVEQFKKGSEQRFQKGFIPKAELSRSALAYLDLEKTLQEVNTELESSKQQLFMNFGDTGKSKTLKTELKVGESFLKLTEKELRDFLTQNSSETIAISRLQSDSAKLEVDAYPYKYAPVMNFEARIPFNEDTGVPIKKTVGGRPVYTVNLTWNIFNGGADRAEQRRLYAIREQTDLTYHDTLVQYATDAEKQVALVVQARNAYLKVKEGLTLWKDIITGSQQRFEKGLVSSKDLNDDISSYLAYTTSYHQQTLDLILTISDYCMLVGKEELFHKLMDI